MTDLVDEIGRLFAQLTRRTREEGEELALTSTQRLALAELALSAPLRLGDLAERMGISDATASRAIDALVTGGLVERAPDAQDRRAILVRPTNLGTRKIRERRAQIEHALRGLSAADRAQLARLLARLNDTLDAA
jgi:DNA-binding MarR family transcriptional regulator